MSRGGNAAFWVVGSHWRQRTQALQKAELQTAWNQHPAVRAAARRPQCTARRLRRTGWSWVRSTRAASGRSGCAGLSERQVAAGGGCSDGRLYRALGGCRSRRREPANGGVLCTAAWTELSLAEHCVRLCECEEAAVLLGERARCDRLFFGPLRRGVYAGMHAYIERGVLARLRVGCVERGSFVSS